MEKYEKPRMEVIELEAELRTWNPGESDPGIGTGTGGSPIVIGGIS